MWEEQAVVLLRANGRLLFRVWTVGGLNFVEMFCLFHLQQCSLNIASYFFVGLPEGLQRSERASIYPKHDNFFLHFILYSLAVFILPYSSTHIHIRSATLPWDGHVPWIISGFSNSRSRDPGFLYSHPRFLLLFRQSQFTKNQNTLDPVFPKIFSFLVLGLKLLPKIVNILSLFTTFYYTFIENYVKRWD